MERKNPRPRSHENPSNMRIELVSVQDAIGLLRFIKNRVHMLRYQVDFVADEIDNSDWNEAVSDWKSGNLGEAGGRLTDYGEQLYKIALKFNNNYESIKAEVGTDRFLGLIDETMELGTAIEEIKARWASAGNSLAAFQLALAAAAPRYASLPPPETEALEAEHVALEPFQSLTQRDHDIFLELD